MATLRRHALAFDPSARMLAASLDASRRSVTLRDGAQLDLGGIAKGLCLDECAAFLPANCALDAGGDAVLRGRDDKALPWLVEIEAPRDVSRVIAKIEATDVCVATSASTRRRWKRGDRAHHHIVDPRTGANAWSDLLQVRGQAPRRLRPRPSRSGR